MKTFHKNGRRAQAGFSLAEMMVVIVIIGLLAGVVVPNVIQKLFTAKDTIAKSEISTIVNSITEYMMANGSYPDSLDQLLDDGRGESYFNPPVIPKDPWGIEYMYDPPSNPGEADFRVYTYSNDKMPGGEGKNADIDNHYLEEK
jgi:general secretion pathway protein G